VEDNELSAGNPGLKPTRSMNMDLMMEKYLPSVGVLSAGAFYKDIKDFIYINTQRDYFDKSSSHIYDKFYQPLNGANATLYGFELAFQRRLDMLPGFLRFLNIYGNYTYTHSRAENPALADDTIKLPGTADHTLNASATFETSRLILGASFNYTSAYLDPYETDLTPMLERYYDRVTYLDFNASYKFMRTMRLYAEVNNLLNQPMRYYAGDPDRTYQMEYYNRRVNAGIKFDL
jgi:TonB-dependent receptor